MSTTGESTTGAGGVETTTGATGIAIGSTSFTGIGTGISATVATGWATILTSSTLCGGGGVGGVGVTHVLEPLRPFLPPFGLPRPKKVENFTDLNFKEVQFLQRSPITYNH